MALRAQEPLPPPRVPEPKGAAADSPSREAHPISRAGGRPAALVLLADLPLLGDCELRGFCGHSRLPPLGDAQHDLAELRALLEAFERVSSLLKWVDLVDDGLQPTAAECGGDRVELGVVPHRGAENRPLIPE